MMTQTPFPPAGYAAFRFAPRGGGRGATVLLLLTLLTLALSSCQKVVNVDLNQSNPQMVIEGVVTDQPGPYTVTVGKTGDYFTPSLEFPPVTNAVVIMTDNSGIVDTLRETAEGRYLSAKLRGEPGRTYALKVFADGKEYDAISTMPPRVKIDSLYATPFREFDGDRGFNVYVVFSDPPQTPNWYRLGAHTTTVPVDSLNGRRFIMFNDKYTNGTRTTFRIRAARRVQAGDTVTVRLYSVDKATYDYYTTVNNILGSDRSPLSIAPANPNNNLNNGSLGYFAAYSTDSMSVVLR